MGKRSNFERRPTDFYPTPFEAVRPLLPWLRSSGIKTFAEPCAGAGDLVRHLEFFGLRCLYRGDITTGEDALAHDSYGPVDCVITNPPHSRNVMHKLIAHFQRIAPTTWLLIDHDWPATKQAVPFLAACSDIVTIGRLRWFAGSKFTGKDNYCWLRFDARHNSGPVFHGRESEMLPLLLDGAAP
jgi:hypothetical protein